MAAVRALFRLRNPSIILTSLKDKEPPRGSRLTGGAEQTGGSPACSKFTSIRCPDEWAKRAWTDEAGYFKDYQASITDPESYWAEQGKRIDWFKPYSQIKDVNYGPGDVHIRWYQDGTLNAAYNCLDRHLEKPRRPGRDHLGRRRADR